MKDYLDHEAKITDYEYEKSVSKAIEDAINEIRETELNKTMKARLDRTQNKLASKILNMPVGNLPTIGLKEGCDEISIHYILKYDQAGNTIGINAAAGKAPRTKKFMDVLKFTIKMRLSYKELLSEIKGTTLSVEKCSINRKKSVSNI